MATVANALSFIDDFQYQRGVTPLTEWYCPIIGIALYGLILAVLPALVKGTKRWECKTYSVIHNIILAFGSLIMLLGVLFGTAKNVRSKGWYILICDEDPNPIRGSAFFWCYIYYLSKYYELVDSVLIILKHNFRQLSVLHCWHHASMIWLSWAWIDGKWTGVWWGATMNCFVHVVMYSYYLLRSYGIEVWWKKYITVLQLMQLASFLIGIFVWFHADMQNLAFESRYPYVFFTKKGCAGSYISVALTQAVNISYIFLFIHFFRVTYSKPRHPLETQKRSQKKVQ